MLHLPPVLVGPGAVLHVEGVAQVYLVLQHIGHSAARPVIGLSGVQAGVGDPVVFIGVHGGAQHLLPPEDAGDLAGAVSGGAQGEDPPHHSGGLLVHHQFAPVAFVFPVAVGGPCPQTLPAPRLGPLHCPDLPAGVPHEPFVEQVLEGHQLAALGVLRVHIVVGGDAAHPELGEPLFDVKPGVQLVAAQPRQVLGDDDSALPVLHVGHHTLEAWAVEAGSRVSVIHIKLWVGEVVVDGVLLQDLFLVLYHLFVYN